MTNYIIGGGFTGLGAGLTSHYKIFESSNMPGGICSSYIKDGFRFEIGGGHWIFGSNKKSLDLINKYSKCKKYQRKSAVFFIGNNKYTSKLSNKFVNYPIQNNLSELENKSLSKQIFNEIKDNSQINKIDSNITMEKWLLKNFGETLNNIFFKPFHEKYTSGLYKEISPQDIYKTPFDLKDVENGLSENPNKHVGYNVSYLYPEKGLNYLAKKMSGDCNIEYNSKLIKIDSENKILNFSNGKLVNYEKLISTIPINKFLEILDKGINFEYPYTSVMVLNLGVEIPDTSFSKHGNHWLYIPDSKSGFHRLGYYSNVDSSFLPEKYNNPQKYASLYIEFAFKNGNKPSNKNLDILIKKTCNELTDLGFIKNIIVYDITWIDVAYTWKKPNNNDLNKYLCLLKEKNIFSIGRYGKWNFQGIQESIYEGLEIKNIIN